MSERSAEVLVEDILEGIDKIQAYTKGLDAKSFCENSLVVDAVLRNFEVIGEAASKLPDTVVASHPEIEWHKMIGMRNRLIHGYFGVSLKLVWQTIQGDMPELKKKLASL